MPFQPGDPNEYYLLVHLVQLEKASEIIIGYREREEIDREMTKKYSSSRKVVGRVYSYLTHGWRGSPAVIVRYSVHTFTGPTIWQI